jgi:predicted O-methyltransferase YrrM
MQQLRDLFLRIKNKYISHKLKTTPTLDSSTFVANPQWLIPTLTGKETIEAIVLNHKNISDGLGVLKNLPKDEYVDFLIKYYSKGINSYGENWKYADIVTVLSGITKNIPINSYLEIGVRTGRSMATVVKNANSCEIVGFDLWIKDYAGMKNPGPEDVKELMNRFGHIGNIELISGDSTKTVPNYFNANPDKYFDLITVDGDHRIKGAKKDLKNIMPRLKIGGFLVFDDISSPHHPYLSGLWESLVKSNPKFETYEFNSVGLGVAVAVRKY